MKNRRFASFSRSPVGAVTIGLALVVVVASLWVTFASAQSPELCAPVEKVDKYRYLRQLTLDLYGRIPTVEEYERLHSMDDVSDEMIDEMVASPEFLSQLRRYHRNLLWSNIGGTEIFDQILSRNRNADFPVWLNLQKRDDFRGANVTCLNMPHPDCSLAGRSVPMVTGYNEGACAGEGCDMDGYCDIEPYWAPGTTVRVCAFDAKEFDMGTPRSNGDPRTCIQASQTDPLCGCGPNLRHCLADGAGGNFDEIEAALVEEPARLFEDVVLAGVPYTDAYSRTNTMMNGPLAHYYRYLANDPDSALRDTASIDYDAGWQQVERPPYHSGILTTLMYLRRFASQRARVNRLYTAFMCDPFEAPAGGLPDATDECSSDPDLSSRCGCASCHSTIEPATTHWGRWEEGSHYVHLTNLNTMSNSCANCEKGDCSNFCRMFYITRELETTPGSIDSELGKLIVLGWRTEEEAAVLDEGPRTLIERPEYQQQLASCAVRNFAEYAFGRELSADELTGWLREQAADFESSDRDFIGMVKRIVKDDRYRRIE